MELIKNLKQLRLSEQKTQKQLADIINTTQYTYSNYETGFTQPSIETLIKLANYYNISLDYLVGRQFSNDLGYMNDAQKEVIKMFLNLDEFKQARVSAYIAGISAER